MLYRAVFALFLLCFWGIAQYDVVHLLQTTYLGFSQATFYPWLSAIVLTLFVMGIGWGIQRLVHRPNAFSCFSALCVSAWISVALSSLPFTSWQGQLCLLGVAILMLAIEIVVQRHWLGHPQATSPWMHSICGWFRVVVLCLYTGLGAMGKDTDHYELRTALAYYTGQFSQAYHVGEHSLAVTPRLFAMRCLLMSVTCEKGLGEKLFEQPIPSGANSSMLLVPMSDGADTQEFPYNVLPSLMQSHVSLAGTPLLEGLYKNAHAHNPKKEKQSPHKDMSIEYFLSGLLLDRQLERFAKEVCFFYPNEVRRGTLPLYFAQAMVLYNRICPNPLVIYHDAAIEANLRDFIEMEATIPNMRQRANLLRRSYGETYWWWYKYGDLK